MFQPYEHYSEVYDLFKPNYELFFDFIEEAMQDYTDNPNSILELACGTGNIFQHFTTKYEVSGLDVSASMLKQARKKLPNVPLFQENMADFDLNRKYDVILCMYDSINHLREYESWIKTFKCVRKHLNAGGIFVFDMNTQEKLDRLSQTSGFVQHQDDIFLITKVTKTAENAVNWNVRIFRHVKENLYELNEDNIEEVTFSPQTIKRDLETLFSKVRFRTKAESLGRVFFICKA